MTKPVRDLRSTAPELALDLSRPTIVIDRDLRARWPADEIWWELELDERSGYVYCGTRILARLVHYADPARTRRGFFAKRSIRWIAIYDTLCDLNRKSARRLRLNEQILVRWATALTASTKGTPL